MYDTIFINRYGHGYQGRRFLRWDEGSTFQTVFYEDRLRCDPLRYTGSDTDHSVMKAAADEMLTEMVDEVLDRGKVTV